MSSRARSRSSPAPGAASDAPPAQAFADRGAPVAITDVSAEASRGVADEIVRTGGQALALTCDVTVSSDVQTALRQSTEAFGRLDFAFNNAGIEQPPLHSPTSPRINGSGFSTSTCAGFSSA